MLRRIKQIIVFFLVVASLYSTMVFVLMINMRSDMRLLEIDYIENTKPNTEQKVLYMDRAQTINDRIRYFTVSKLSFKIPKPKHCSNRQPNNAILIISASAFDPVTILMKFMRQIQVGIEKCQEPDIYVVKRIKHLAFNSEDNIDKFAVQIGQIIKYFTIEVEYEINIFSYQEGSLLTLAYFARKSISLLLTNIVQRVKSIVFVDLGHPLIRVEYDPPYKFMYKLKKQIYKQQQRMKIFNKMKLVFISTHHEQFKNEQLYYTTQGSDQLFTFSNAIIITTRQMANVHYYLPPNSLSFPPLVRTIAHFLSKNLICQMNINQIASFFRHGQSYKYEKINASRVKNCQERDIYRDFTMINKNCFKLNPLKLHDSELLVIFAEGNFQMYGFNYEKVYPFDNLTRGSLYVLEKIDHEIFILNPDKLNIHISKQFAGTPNNPLRMSRETLLMQSQMQFSNYSMVRLCPNMYLAFPIHITMGIVQRQYLEESQYAQKSNKDCFHEDNYSENFARKLLVYWQFFRNLLIFTLLCTQFFNHRPVSQRMILQLTVNYMLILAKHEDIQQKFMFSLYMVLYSIFIEFLLKVIASLGQKLSSIKKMTTIMLLSVSGICILAFIGRVFRDWRVCLVSIVFFINRQNILLFFLKVYFLKDDIAYYGLAINNFGDIGILTMWIYVNLPIHKENDELSKIRMMGRAEKLFTGMLLIMICISLQSSGSFISGVINVYMKIIIVIKMLKIMKK